MMLHEQGLRYWLTAQRFNNSKHLAGAALMAVHDMEQLLPVTASEAVRRRITAFVNRHGPRPPVSTA